MMGAAIVATPTSFPGLTAEEPDANYLAGGDPTWITSGSRPNPAQEPLLDGLGGQPFSIIEDRVLHHFPPAVTKSQIGDVVGHSAEGYIPAAYAGWRQP